MRPSAEWTAASQRTCAAFRNRYDLSEEEYCSAVCPEVSTLRVTLGRPAGRVAVRRRHHRRRRLRGGRAGRRGGDRPGRDGAAARAGRHPRAPGLRRQRGPVLAGRSEDEALAAMIRAGQAAN